MKITPSGLFLIGVNLIPIFGVLFLGWNASAIIFLYWFEGAIIGILNIPKILTAQGKARENPATYGSSKNVVMSRVGTAFFFSFHFGIFTLVHGIFVLVMFGKGLSEQEGLASMVGLAALTFFISHGFSMIRNYYGRGEYKTRTPQGQMFMPYGRIFVMHFVILGGGWLIDKYGITLYALILLVILKTVLDLIMHAFEHRDEPALISN